MQIQVGAPGRTWHRCRAEEKMRKMWGGLRNYRTTFSGRIVIFVIQVYPS
jgi:hypothetical protein